MQCTVRHTIWRNYALQIISSILICIFIVKKPAKVRLANCFNGALPWFATDTWWRHQMETFSALLAICAGNSSVAGDVPAQWPVKRSFHVFFDLRLNKPLSKQSWGWWFETLSPHYDVIVMQDNGTETGGRLNKKDGLTRYGDSHVKDKTS